MCFKGDELSEKDAQDAKVDGKTHTQTQQALIQNNKEEMSVCKLLLLGPGASGKSTIFKQMKILHLGGFKPTQLKIYKDILLANVKEIFETTLSLTQEWNYAIAEEHAPIVQFLVTETLSVKAFPLTEENSDALVALWKDAGMQKTIEKRSEYNLLDSYEYLIDNLGRIAKKDYVPSPDDILRSRSKTTGISEERFTLPDSNGGSMKILMVDVGGQRNERRKWIHAFDGVTLIIYVVGLSEYDQTLEERKEVNRLSEALSLFKDIVNFQGFKKKTVILFFNKKDLFEKKIKKVDLNVCPDFTDYKGGCDYDKAIDAIRKKFKANDMSSNRTLMDYVTCATDTKQVELVMKGCTSAITKAYLDSVALL
jgi:GTPase SAR1 family protein